MFGIVNVVFPDQDLFPLGAYVKKKSGAFWEGTVVGFYSTKQTPKGYCVQLYGMDAGPVQIYPHDALVLAPKKHRYEDWNKMLQFLLDHPDEDTFIFLKTWAHGEWDVLDRDWPEWKAFIDGK